MGWALAHLPPAVVWPEGSASPGGLSPILWVSWLPAGSGWPWQGHGAPCRVLIPHQLLVGSVPTVKTEAGKAEVGVSHMVANTQRPRQVALPSSKSKGVQGDRPHLATGRPAGSQGPAVPRGPLAWPRRPPGLLFPSRYPRVTDILHKAPACKSPSQATV